MKKTFEKAELKIVAFGGIFTPVQHACDTNMIATSTCPSVLCYEE